MAPSLALVLSLLAADVERPLKVAAPTLGVIKLEARLGEFYTEHVAQQLKVYGLEVVTSKEIATLLGMERQKQLIGCSEGNGACIAELANALGVDAMLMGDVALVAEKYQVNLKLISASTGKTLAVFAESTTESTIIETLTRGAQLLAVDSALSTGRTPPYVGPSRAIPGTLLIAGALIAGGGAAALVYSENAYQTLSTGTPGPDGATLKTNGQLTGTMGVVGLAVGGAAIVSGVVVLLATGRPPTRPSTAVSALVAPGVAGVALGGTFP